MSDDYQRLPRVILVNPDGTFVINRGEQSSVKVGDKFLIFTTGDQVIDPYNGQNLGVLEIVRGRARVKHVQQKMATLESNEISRKRISKGFSRGVAGGLLSIPDFEEETETALIHAAIGDMARKI